jgi:hypothetical protein
MSAMKIRIRPRQADDDGLIYSSWIHHFAKASGLVIGDVDDGARAVIDLVLHKPTTLVRVAVDSEDGRKIRGYCVSDPTTAILHFVCAKADAREWGVARTLLEDASARLDDGCVWRAWHLPRNARWVRRCVKLRFDPRCLQEVM